MFTLDQVVPWGRSDEEYFTMFSLTGADMVGRILTVGMDPQASMPKPTEEVTR